MPNFRVRTLDPTEVPGICAIHIHDEMRGWREGEFLVFDKTWNHEAWNLTDAPRVVLFVQVVRPMKWPGRLVGKAFLQAIRRTNCVQDARKAIGA